jgi:DHA2 family multidrug resistance protein
MRNLGGSVGIALTSTMLSRRQQSTAALFGSNVTQFDPGSQSIFAQMRAAFVAAGADAVTATNRAYAVLAGMVQRQAALVSFVAVFQLPGHVPGALPRAADEAVAHRRPPPGAH